MVRPIRSIQVCGVQLKKYRTNLNWTQNDLAKAAGYSSRLIRKLESGGSADPETLCNIAEALSVAGQSIGIEALTIDNLAVAKSWMNALNQEGARMVDTIADYLAPDFEFYCPGDPNMIPFAGTWKGRAGLQRFLDIYFSIFERIPHSAPIFSVGDNLVIARYFEQGSVNGTPTPPIRINLCFHFKAGKILRIDDDYDVLSSDDSVRLVSSEESKKLSSISIFLRYFDELPRVLPEALLAIISKELCTELQAPESELCAVGSGDHGLQSFFEQLASSIQEKPKQFTHEILRSPERIIALFQEPIALQGIAGSFHLEVAFQFQGGLIKRLAASISRKSVPSTPTPEQG